jgi:hydrogenase maturation protein HypF
MVAAGGQEIPMMEVQARRVVVEGIVQGVGFRPFVHTLATRHGLRGWVRNTAQGVEIEAEGLAPALETFLERLTAEVPPLAHIHRITTEDGKPLGLTTFEIVRSQDGQGFQPVPPDVATCPECLREIFDPLDRRFHYPFTNCTNCGPRFTIIVTIPYDRPNTTMKRFEMCGECRQEYENPFDRRFHAQPNACPACGPHLKLVDASGRPISGDPLAKTRALLRSGLIVAIKGLGGFHLACDAADEVAVRRLRERKGREAKPLALMVTDMVTAERYCVLSERERSLLNSQARPIVLCQKRREPGIAPSVAPGIGHIGLMLPYSPLHHLLFDGDGCPKALVMTSGNRSDEPIATENIVALARLGGIADAFLIHDRPIHVRCDDSVARIAGEAEMPIRRSRGYAPFPVRLPFESCEILACGAELKSTVCLSRGPYAFMSPHIGDLENYETYSSYHEMVERIKALFGIEPEAIAHDLHPNYLSTRYALEADPALPRVAVQHHHAHIAACMVEHSLIGPVIGIAFDGTGYGTDGKIWGGEFLIADYSAFRRVAHLSYVPMPGGDRAAREPFRMALAHLRHACGEWSPRLLPVQEGTSDELRVIARQIDSGLNAPMTSSVGRLFDAVASLLGVRHRARYEAQAAMELEALVDSSEEGSYPVVLTGSEPVIIDSGPIIRGIMDDLERLIPIPVIAARFHWTLAATILENCIRIRRATGLNRVVMSGGVFQNMSLLSRTCRDLEHAGFEVFTHRVVPANDGGIALGQVAIAQARLAGTASARGFTDPALSDAR